MGSQLKDYLKDDIYSTNNPIVKEIPELPSYTIEVKLRHQENIDLHVLKAHLLDMEINPEGHNIITITGIPPDNNFDILAVVQLFDTTAEIISSRRWE